MIRLPTDHPRRRSETGGSLVELTIAIAVTVVLIGAVMHMCVYNAKSRKLDDELRLALSSCENVLEEARSLQLDEIPLLDGQNFDVLGRNGEPGGLAPVKGASSTMAGVIASVLAQSATGFDLYRVTARVQWQGVMGNRIFELSTLITER
jgi:type II secretory pathway pseudopilin PulG